MKNFLPSQFPAIQFLSWGGIASLDYNYYGFLFESLLLKFRIEAWLRLIFIKMLWKISHNVSNLLIAVSLTL